VAWGGTALAILGLSGMFGSYLWGYLSARVSAFVLILAAQLACAPLYLLLLRADSAAGLALLSFPTGLCMGGALFPLLATASRRSRQLTPGLRAGVIVGGTWGLASLLPMGCGWLTDYGVTVGQLLHAAVFLILGSAALSLVIHLSARRRRPEAG
jgi:hypothetical protein